MAINATGPTGITWSGLSEARGYFLARLAVRLLAVFFTVFLAADFRATLFLATGLLAALFLATGFFAAFLALLTAIVSPPSGWLVTV